MRQAVTQAKKANRLNIWCEYQRHGFSTPMIRRQQVSIPPKKEDDRKTKDIEEKPGFFKRIFRKLRERKSNNGE